MISLKVISRGVSITGKGFGPFVLFARRWLLGEELISLFPYSAVMYMVSLVAVKNIAELYAAVVAEFPVVDELTMVVVLLVLLLEGEDKEIYKGWNLNDGSTGSSPESSPKRVSTTHFMLGLDCGS